MCQCKFYKCNIQTCTSWLMMWKFFFEKKLKYTYIYIYIIYLLLLFFMACNFVMMCHTKNMICDSMIRKINK
jgi:hypothetical protein